MDCLVPTVIAIILTAGVTYAVTIKITSNKKASGKSRIVSQNKIDAGGDVAGGDITKKK